jgi:hypothetical protein
LFTGESGGYKANSDDLLLSGYMGIDKEIEKEAMKQVFGKL